MQNRQPASTHQQNSMALRKKAISKLGSVTCHMRSHSCFNPASQAENLFTNPRGING